MAKHDAGNATASSILDASTGDTVWLFESQMNLHDDQGKYLGRGVWKLAPIESETRVSFVVQGSKFDRKSGAERPRSGFTSGNRIAGEVEKSDHIWVSDNRYKLIRHLERCDARTLRNVADLIGWRP